MADSRTANGGRGEDEPLLGRAGDASQPEDQGLQFNFLIGTAVIAQVGIWLLTVTVWASVFTHPPLILFAAHPLLNSAGILVITQGILLLQPTHTPKQKVQGAHIHAIFNSTGTLALLAGLIVIEYNKISHAGGHFESPHAILGTVTYILFFLQAIVGVAQFYTPSVFGSVDNAKSVYKYHRISGYVLLVLSLVTVALATQTGFNKSSLHIQLWAVVVLAVITLVGVLPRIKKQKLGL
ncbi:MAG: hypothetical protein LQ342_001921 [Letrouitia transgressa]|nr:MAG: hypothetical protein LQ342_001921 [Letrouitia transgressa]